MDQEHSEPTPGDTKPKVAVVTGGGGGIGRAICQDLAEEGYVLVIADQSDHAMDAFISSLPGPRSGTRHQLFTEDLVNPEAHQRLAEYARSLGRVVVLVNAIGISPKKDGQKVPFDEMDHATWDAIMKVNLYAPFYAMQAISRVMLDDDSASIVNITSVTAKTGTGGYSTSGFVPAMPSSAAYGATKAALANLTLSLSHELAGRGIRVNSVAPGYVETTMMGAVEKTDRLMSTVPMGRFAKPEEVAGAVRFLTSSQASFITGATVEVNGGWTSM